MVEACTNPNVNTLEDGILVNGFNTKGESINNDEIVDTCNSRSKTVIMSDISCSVQSYWSKADNRLLMSSLYDIGNEKKDKKVRESDIFI